MQRNSRLQMEMFALCTEWMCTLYSSNIQMFISLSTLYSEPFNWDETESSFSYSPRDIRMNLKWL